MAAAPKTGGGGTPLPQDLPLLGPLGGPLKALGKPFAKTFGGSIMEGFVFALEGTCVSNLFLWCTKALSMRSSGSIGRAESEKWDIYPVCPVEEVPLPGNRGRLGSEPGKVGGGR